jgi:hypothetical protein
MASAATVQRAFPPAHLAQTAPPQRLQAFADQNPLRAAPVLDLLLQSLISSGMNACSAKNLRALKPREEE